MRRRLLLLLIILGWPPIVLALDHDNLDPNRPIQMEDAYAIPEGEIGLESGVRFNDRRRGRTGVIFQPQIIYGAFRNTQIEIQTDLLTEPLSAVGPNGPETCISVSYITSIRKRSSYRPLPCARKRTCRPASIRAASMPRSRVL